MFKGSIAAPVTPFADGRIDELALRDLIEWQIEEGSFGLVPCGTTGESPIGNDLTVAHAASAGQLRLNAMEPVIVLSILQSNAHADKGHGDLEETLHRWYRSRRGSDFARPIRCSRHAVGVARRIQQSIQSFQKGAGGEEQLPRRRRRGKMF